MTRRIIANNILFDEVCARVAEGFEVEIPTKGNSMFPFIRGGQDSLVLMKVEQLGVGDIVLAKINDKSYVAHRIIAIDGDIVTLMGDGNIRGEEICTQQQICAKVKYIMHNDQVVDCNSQRQRRRAKLWFRLLPLRRYILAVWRRVAHI